jgi:YVTN family beta-propeller protein
MEIGPEPNELAVTPDGKIAYIPVSDGHYEVVDLAARKIIKRISTGGRPHNTLCSADGKHMYLAPMGSVKKVFVADTSKHEIVGEISFSDVVRPIVLARDEKRLYAEVDNLLGFEVADVAAGKMIERVSSELDEKFKNKPSRSHGLAIRPNQKELWECDVEHFQVHVFDITGEKPKQAATIDIGTQVYWLTFSPDGSLCYVAARGGNEVAVIDVQSRKVQTRIAVGKAPKRLLVVTMAEEK